MKTPAGIIISKDELPQFYLTAGRMGRPNSYHLFLKNPIPFGEETQKQERF